MKVKLTKALIDSLEPIDKDQIVWDTVTPGFAIKITPVGRKTFFLKYRLNAQQRKPSIGLYGEITLAQARTIAKDWIFRIKGGEDVSLNRQAARRGRDMNFLFSEYLRRHAVPHKRESSVREDKAMYNRHIEERFGKIKILDVTQDDIEALHLELKDKPYRANRLLSLLKKMFNLSEQWNLRPRGTNPCDFIEKYEEKERHRPLSEIELHRLGKAMKDCELKGTIPVRTIAAVRLLILTGCRKREILNLAWSQVDLEKRIIRLQKTKTTARIVHLSSAAIEVLESIAPVPGTLLVFPGRFNDKPLRDILKPWKKLCKMANIQGCRIHDLRHGVGETGGDLGLSEFQLMKVLGHNQAKTTKRYVDVGDNAQKEAVEIIGETITRKLNGGQE